MPTLTIATPEGIRLRLEIAGAGSRFCAALLDALLFGSLYVAAALIVMLVAAIDRSGLSNLMWGILIGGLPLSLALYQLVFHALRDGQTPGKRALGLRVASADGYPASLMQHFLRFALWPVDVLLLVPVSVGILVITLSERRQRLGDLAAGTLVLRERAREERPEPFPGERWSALEDRTLRLEPGLAARLSAEDLELLRELWTRPELTLEERRRLFVATARHYAQRLELGDFKDARTVLRELYLFLREAREGRA
ncbi:MAG TPA: RDD family protein [Planctomycetota bacterium]|nr:RDD family protein [Planctomycetota bacterium]